VKTIAISPQHCLKQFSPIEELTKEIYTSYDMYVCVNKSFAKLLFFTKILLSTCPKSKYSNVDVCASICRVVVVVKEKLSPRHLEV
jgi:hypothetical protein